MNWLRIVESSVSASLLVSLTDWYFFGVLFHDKYLTYPEVWRRNSSGGGESRAIIWGTLLSAFTCVAFVLFCVAIRRTRLPETLGIAAMIWLMTAVPLIVTNALFMKIDRAIVVSHSLGW